jgi:hypothetical protein
MEFGDDYRSIARRVRNDKMQKGWREFIHDRPVDTPTETADYEHLVSSIAPWKPRVITGTFEAAGSNASNHEHALYYDVFQNPMNPRMSLPVRPPVHGKDAHEYSCAYSEAAAKEITTYTPPKYKVIRPSRWEKTDQIASQENAHMNALYDHVDLKYINFDRMERAMDGAETINDQVQRVGPDGAVVRIDDRVLEDQGSDGRYRGMGILSRPDTFEKPEVCIEYATELASRPPSSLQLFYKQYPQAGLMMKQMLEEIANLTIDQIMPEDAHSVSAVIRHSLEFADVNRLYDPMMLEFVVPGDERYINLGGIRANYDRIEREFTGQYEDVPQDVAEIMYPLAIHMWEHDIPVSTANINAEAQALLDVREEIHKIATSHMHQLQRGGIEEVLALANQDELNVLNQVDKGTLMDIFRCMPEGGHAMEFPEMIQDLPDHHEDSGLRGSSLIEPSSVVAGNYTAPETARESVAHSAFRPCQYVEKYDDPSKQRLYDSRAERSFRVTTARQPWYSTSSIM